MSPDLLRQQLTMTSVAEGEEIEDGLATPRHPPPKHSNKSRPHRPHHLMSLVLLRAIVL